MGYTHYWDVCGWDSLPWQIAWPKVVEDARLILAATDVLVSGPGDETDEVTSPLIDVDKGIHLNGVADDSHEAFEVGPELHGAFCKTLQKPYDLVVACILLRMHMLAPRIVRVNSDGHWNQEEWKKARELYRSLWPDEAVWCPWQGPPVDETGKYTFEGSPTHFGHWTMFFDFDGEYHGPEEWLLAEDGRRLTPREWLLLKASEDRKGAVEDALSKNIAELVETMKSDYPGPADSQNVVSTVTGLDFTPIKQWLSRCGEDEAHANCKATAIEWTDYPGVHFRLIDTKRKCIVDTGNDIPPFIVLSYVWGGNQPKLTSSTVALFKSEGGLEKVWANIPTTIRDAITVCEELGERYLWVDALCIMQDSSKDRRLQVLRMRQIYAAAKCTIAAVSSTAAKEGLLPDTNGPRAPECKSEAELDELLGRAPWSTRAWCYQEKVLSHRMIFFTTSGVYLQCQGGTFDSRGTPLPPRPSGSGDTLNRVGALLRKPSTDDLESYLTAAEHFSKRKVTLKDDKMNAFQGVLQLYSRNMNGQTTSFAFGLPICAFDQTFCWRTAHHNPEARNDSFPSWSWLGWDEPVIFERALTRHARTNQMIYDEQHADPSPESLEVRKPAGASFLAPQRNFGFPAASSFQFYNNSSKYVQASVADLRIAKDPVDTEASNGLYPVYGMKCSQQRPAARYDAPQPKPLTLLEALELPMPEIVWMDEETEAAPSLPAKKQTGKEYDIVEHADHHDCEAKVPIGHIWLDKSWREARPEHCVMEFMALHGEKAKENGEEKKKEAEEGKEEKEEEAKYSAGNYHDEDEDGDHNDERWIITMLMLTQRMAKKDSFWAHERVQVMDCCLTEEEWARTGADLKRLKIV